MGSIMAGQISGLIQKEQSCREIIEEMFGQAEKLIIQKAEQVKI